jgi:SWIM zinc finger
MASTIVTSYDLESDTFTHHAETPARQAWRQAVAAIAEKAKAKLPECAGRVDSAVKIVLAGDVELQADGTAKVASQSNGSTAYHVVNGECSCKDFAKAPHQFCKHRLAAAITRRVQELTKAKLEGTNGQTETSSQPTQPEALRAPLPEAPASVNCHITLEGRQVQVTLRDTDETRLLGRLAALLRQYPLAETQQPTQGHNASQPGWCAKHGVQMRQNHKEGRSWWSHRLADGTWCKGKLCRESGK